MQTICQKCGTQYDDAERSTICPHARFLTPEHQAQKDLALSLIGKDLVFAHEAGKPSGPITGVVHVESVDWRGMVTLRGWSGYFAPSLFRVLETR